MPDHIRESIPKLRSAIEALEQRRSKELVTAEDKLRAAHDLLDEIEASWSGSPIGYHADIYYKDFQPVPPHDAFNREWGRRGLSPNWHFVTYDDLKDVVEENVEAKLDDLYAVVTPVIEDAKRLQREFSTELAVIDGDESLKRESEALKELGDVDFGFSAQDFAEYRMPKGQFITRDQEAMSQGARMAPHIKLIGHVASLRSKINSVDKFCNEAKALLRQLEIKRGAATSGSTTFTHAEMVLTLCRRFHAAARQLRDRHKDRATLTIEDEYDVQDLLHALLRIFFEDVRPEEYTPSYAGGSSRVDFLLKNEQIIVEVKKTRKGLADKEVGEQLLVDIQRYKKHPDCKTLICFVYDAEGRIGNPRGLEADLGQQSSPELEVIVVIAPDQG